MLHRFHPECLAISVAVPSQAPQAPAAKILEALAARSLWTRWRVQEQKWRRSNQETVRKRFFPSASSKLFSQKISHLFVRPCTEVFKEHLVLVLIDLVGGMNPQVRVMLGILATCRGHGCLPFTLGRGEGRR